MYTDIRTALDNANKSSYAVLAASAFNIKLARGLIAAADEIQALLIILMDQARMTKHARPELMVPIVKTLAEQINVPVTLTLDHGRNWEKITWAYRQGFSSIMMDTSTCDMERSIARAKEAVRLCHARGLAVEDELGHVGQAATLDGCDVSLYTKPEEAVRFVQETEVGSLTTICGTTHGDYPEGFTPTVNFDVVEGVKQAVNMPLALHSGSESRDGNIRKTVEAGINKVNTATEIFNAYRDYTKNRLDEEPDLDYMSFMTEMEQECRKMVKHFISLTGPEGKIAGFKRRYVFCHGISRIDTGIGE